VEFFFYVIFLRIHLVFFIYVLLLHRYHESHYEIATCNNEQGAKTISQTLENVVFTQTPSDLTCRSNCFIYNIFMTNHFKQKEMLALILYLFLFYF
jgi:hypothetical protein